MEKLAMNSPPQKLNNDTSNTRGKEKGVVTNSTDEMDTSEKERRQKIKSLFAHLHAMHPHVPRQMSRDLNQPPTSLSAEETFKQVAAEIIQRLS